jgi:putative SOS response-associated peptidase YedK
MVSNQEAMRAFFKLARDITGNLAPMPGIYPDYAAPIVRNRVGGRELAMARWGMPSPQFALEGKKTDPGVTNIRNAKSPHWRRWLGAENRCVVPFTSFSEPDGVFGRPARHPERWWVLRLRLMVDVVCVETATSIRWRSAA